MQPEPVVEEAEGYKLHLSGKSATGYKGVCKESNGFFRAERYANNKTISLGVYSTAVEAAVAIAKRVKREPDMLCGDRAGGGGLQTLHLSSKNVSGYKGVWDVTSWQIAAIRSANCSRQTVTSADMTRRSKRQWRSQSTWQSKECLRKVRRP